MGLLQELGAFDSAIAAAHFLLIKLLHMVGDVIHKNFTFSAKDWVGVCILSVNYPTRLISLKCLGLTYIQGVTQRRAH